MGQLMDSKIKRILVCGGRTYGLIEDDKGNYRTNFEQVELLEKTLDKELAQEDFILIHGAARGADSLAAEWAARNKVQTLAFPAKWNKYGRAAGYYRNLQMLEEGEPDKVIAFPGGQGTQMMIALAKRVKVEVDELV